MNLGWRRFSLSASNHQLLLVAIFFVATVLRLGLLDRHSLWADEVFSIAMATGHSLEHPAADANPKLGDFVEFDHPVPAVRFRDYLTHTESSLSLSRVLRAVLLSDTSPPLYYLLLDGWMMLAGTSDVALRLFSLICAMACFPVLVTITRYTVGNRGVLPAVALFAFSPWSVFYSTEGRMYSLLWLFVSLAALASLLLSEGRNGYGTYVLWISASLGGLLTHYFFIFPWLAMIVFLFIRPGKHSRWRLTLLILGSTVLAIPWYVNLPDSMARWRVTEGWEQWRPPGFSPLRAFIELTLQWFSGRSGPVWNLWKIHPFSNVTALLIFVLVGAIAAWRLRSELFAGSRLLLWFWFAAACAGPCVFDLVRQTSIAAVARYAIAALPAACALGGLGLACLSSRSKNVMVAAVLVAWSPNLGSIYQSQSRSGPSVRAITQALSADGGPSDIVLVDSVPSDVLAIARYLPGTVPVASWVEKLGTRSVPGSVRALAAGHSRILLVDMNHRGANTVEENWLRANAIVCRERGFGAARIIEFCPPRSNLF